MIFPARPIVNHPLLDILSAPVAGFLSVLRKRCEPQYQLLCDLETFAYEVWEQVRRGELDPKTVDEFCLKWLRARGLLDAETAPQHGESLTATIYSVLAERFAGLTAYEVNQGQCEDFQREVINAAGLDATIAERVTENLAEALAARLPGHCWVFHDGRHYDAEAPDGVTDPLDLPIFARCLGKSAPSTKE